MTESREPLRRRAHPDLGPAARGPLSRTRDLLELALEAGRMGTWEIELPDGPVAWSESYGELHGRGPAEHPRDVAGLLRCIHPDDREVVRSELSRAAQSGSDLRLDYRLVRPDGAECWHSASGRVLRAGPGGPVRAIGVGLNVAPPLQIERDLRETEERFRILVTGVRDYAIVMLDPEGRVRSWNPGAAGITGWTAEEALGQPFDTFFTPEEREAGRPRELLQIAEREGRVEEEGLRVRRDGTRFWAHVVLTALRDERGRLSGFADVTRDDDERRRAEEARDRLEGQLRQSQKLEAVGTLAGGIAHDFNNILLAIQGHTELAGLKLPPDSPSRRHLREVLSATARATDLVRQILTFSRPGGEQRRPLALAPVVKEAVRLLRASLPATVGITVAAPPDLPPVLADAGQIHQAVLNLCTNASQAIGRSTGAISLALELEEVRDPRPGAAGTDLRPGRYVSLSVSDTGRGIPAGDLTRIFDPFFTTKAAGEGTGLGLAVVLGIVRAHRGGIVVESQPERGTVVRLFLPAAEARPVEPPAVLGEVPRGRGETVLFVDDEPLLRRFASEVLRRAGYRPVVCATPQEALDRLAGGPAPDLVITDLTMPGMSGLDLARQIGRRAPGIPILLSSGYAGPADREEADALGIRELLAKPFRADDLALAVHRALRPR